MSKDIVFSGVQPTGEIHLGNYLGAIKQFLNFQNDCDSIFCIVDQHAITIFQDPNELKENVLSVLAIFLASGLDPKKCIIFNQASVREHSVLSWYLSCTARVGWLNRMTQFKDKAGKNRDNASLGLYAYPVLMAADILLYHADKVPVGDDQKQHLELTRDIAHKFNTDYRHEYFKLPDPIINKDAPRIMSLRDANNKMSKSDVSKYSRILLTDSNDEISTKISKAKSDSLKMPSSSDELSDRPEVNNLITSFDYYNQNESYSKNSYLTNTTQLIFDDFNSLSFSTRKNKIGHNKSLHDPIIQKFDLALKRVCLNLAKQIIIDEVTTKKQRMRNCLEP